MDYEYLLFAVEDHIATVTLNRPEKRNALNFGLWQEIEKACGQVDADPEIRVMVLRGAGPAFCSGNDMSQPSNPELRYWNQRLYNTNRRTLRLWSVEKPTIAMVRGHAIAAGCELALACDMTIASANAWFGEPEIRHGSMAQLMMPWYVGAKAAKEFILGGDTIDAQEAWRLGIVNKVYPDDRLEVETYQLARKLAKIPADATRLNKRAMNKAFEIMGIREHSAYLSEVSTLLHVMMFDVQDEEGAELQRIKYQQGVKAFLQAREARFEG